MKRNTLLFVFVFAFLFTQVVSFAQSDYELLQKIVAGDRGADDNFGTSVSISGNMLLWGRSMKTKMQMVEIL